MNIYQATQRVYSRVNEEVSNSQPKDQEVSSLPHFEVFYASRFIVPDAINFGLYKVVEELTEYKE